MDDVLSSSEIEFYIETLFAQNLEDIGTEKWVGFHQRLQKLNQQAIVEASLVKYESVKETFVTFNKVWVLIHEAVLIRIWKHKILDNMLEIHTPKCTFIAYSVLFHEAISVSLLEVLLFHTGCCESLEDFGADLLDYSYESAAQLIVLELKEVQVGENCAQELQRQKIDLSFDIGIRCLSIIRYLAENLDKIALNVSSRIYNIHDAPILLVEILTKKPWIKNGKCYVKGKWLNIENEALGQPEAQVWLTLRQLLLDERCAQCYFITDTHRNKLLKLLPLLQPNLLDQLPPLMDLNHWLCRLSMTDQSAAVFNRPLLIEPILELKEKILKLKQGGKRWKKIARAQVNVVFPSDTETLTKIARSLNEAYNTELLEKLEIKEQAKCASCDSVAIQRCSRCKSAWYCSRKCQVVHWEEHKGKCLEPTP